jgi:hypothetical protein
MNAMNALLRFARLSRTWGFLLALAVALGARSLDPAQVWLLRSLCTGPGCTVLACDAAEGRDCCHEGGADDPRVAETEACICCGHVPPPEPPRGLASEHEGGGAGTKRSAAAPSPEPLGGFAGAAVPPAASPPGPPGCRDLRHGALRALSPCRAATRGARVAALLGRALN